MSVCPDCIGGEHHPTHEVATLDVHSMEPRVCMCPCAERVYGPHVLTVGERGFIFAGRYVDRILSIDAIQGGMFVGTVLDHTSTPKVIHVPTNWVRRIDA